MRGILIEYATVLLSVAVSVWFFLALWPSPYTVLIGMAVGASVGLGAVALLHPDSSEGEETDD